MINDLEYEKDPEVRCETNTGIEEEKKIKCDNCESLFMNKQTLRIHKKTSIKCQNLSKDDDTLSSSSSDSVKKCEFCEKIFASKQMRLYHESKCIDKIVHDLKKQHSREIDSLNSIIENLRKELQTKCEI